MPMRPAPPAETARESTADVALRILINGDQAVQTRIESMVDLAHAARTQRRDNLVGSDAFSRTTTHSRPVLSILSEPDRLRH